MELQFAHLADFATQDARGKLILVGIFEFIMVTDERPIVLPVFSLVARFRAFPSEGTEHTLTLKLVDADGKQHSPDLPLKFKFMPEGPRRPLRGQVTANFGAGLTLPDLGDYTFELFIDGHRYGGVPLSVLPAPKASSGKG